MATRKPQSVELDVVVPKRRGRPLRQRGDAREIKRPCSMPPEATHFRLRKGGRQNPSCTFVEQGGVERHYHPIEEFTADLISKRWGYDRSYWVSFTSEEDGIRTTLGGSRMFGLVDPAEAAASALQEVVPGTEVYSARAEPDTSLSGPLAMLHALRDITGKDAQAQIAAHQVQSAAALQATREAGQSQMAMMLKMFEILAPRSAPAPAIDPTLAALLGQMVENQKATAAALEKLAEEPEDEDETDEDRLERAMKKYEKSHDFKVLKNYMEEETIYGFFKAFPKVKEKLPALALEVWTKLQPILAAMMPPAPAAATSNPAPAQQNGAAIAPKRAAAPRVDLHTPKVE